MPSMASINSRAWSWNHSLNESLLWASHRSMNEPQGSWHRAFRQFSNWNKRMRSLRSIFFSRASRSSIQGWILVSQSFRGRTFLMEYSCSESSFTMKILLPQSVFSILIWTICFCRKLNPVMFTKLNDSECEITPPIIYEAASLLFSLYNSPFFSNIPDVPCSIGYTATGRQTLQILSDTLLPIGPHLPAFLVIIFSVELSYKESELFFGSRVCFFLWVDTA